MVCCTRARFRATERAFGHWRQWVKLEQMLELPDPLVPEPPRRVPPTEAAADDLGHVPGPEGMVAADPDPHGAVAGEADPLHDLEAFHLECSFADLELIERWAPDLVLDTGHGTLRLAELTRTARPLLLDLTEDACYASEVDGWRDRVDTVTGSTRDSHACALLLRPDCYVAWATDTPRPDHHDRESLRTALTTWFGPC